MMETPSWEKKSRTRTRGANVLILLIWFLLVYYYFINYNDILVCDRYSTRCLLNDFPDSNFFEISGAKLNPYQMPILLFMKHIMCWPNYGDFIVDATSGTKTLAVHLFCVYFPAKSVNNSQTYKTFNCYATDCSFVAGIWSSLLQYTGHFLRKMLVVRQSA
jgi:hypothetical protein